jgi:hypothetical protein
MDVNLVRLSRQSALLNRYEQNRIERRVSLRVRWRMDVVGWKIVASADEVVQLKGVSGDGHGKSVLTHQRKVTRLNVKPIIVFINNEDQPGLVGIFGINGLDTGRKRVTRDRRGNDDSVVLGKVVHDADDNDRCL